MPLGPRGVGWLIWVEVLSGLLSGVAVSKDITWHASAEHPWEAGVFLMAINIDRLVPIDQFKARVDDLIRAIKSSRLAEGFDEIVLPGEHAQREEERRLKEGISIRDEDWDYLSNIAAEVGIDLDSLRS